MTNDNYSKASISGSNLAMAGSKPTEKQKAPQPLRLLMVFIFISTSVTGGVLVAPLSPITKTIKKTYGLSIGEINLFSSLWGFSSLFGGLVATSIMGSLGVRKSLLVGSTLYFICSVMRLFMNESVLWMYASCIVGGLGYPFVEYGASPFVAHWFDDNEIGPFVMVLSCTQTVGSMVASMYPFLFVDPNSSASDLRDQAALFLRSLCTLSLWVLLASWLFFHENKIRVIEKLRSKAASSKASGGENDSTEVSSGQKLKFFTTDARYLFLVGCFLSLYYGSMVFTYNQTTLYVIWGYSEVRKENLVISPN